MSDLRKSGGGDLSGKQRDQDLRCLVDGDSRSLAVTRRSLMLAPPDRQRVLSKAIKCGGREATSDFRGGVSVRRG
jgi:hypothetical protein